MGKASSEMSRVLFIVHKIRVQCCFNVIPFVFNAMIAAANKIAEMNTIRCISVLLKFDK